MPSLLPAVNNQGNKDIFIKTSVTASELLFGIMDLQEGNFPMANTQKTTNPSNLDLLWIISFKDLYNETSCANRCACGIVFLMNGEGAAQFGNTSWRLYFRIITAQSRTVSELALTNNYVY